MTDEKQKSDQEETKQEEVGPVDYKKMYSTLKEENLALSGDYNTLITDYKDALEEIKELKEEIAKTPTSTVVDPEVEAELKAALKKIRKLQEELRRVKQLVPTDKIMRHQ